MKTSNRAGFGERRLSVVPTRDVNRVLEEERQKRSALKEEIQALKDGSRLRDLEAQILHQQKTIIALTESLKEKSSFPEAAKACVRAEVEAREKAETALAEFNKEVAAGDKLRGDYFKATKADVLWRDQELQRLQEEQAAVNKAFGVRISKPWDEYVKRKAEIRKELGRPKIPEGVRHEP